MYRGAKYGVLLLTTLMTEACVKSDGVETERVPIGFAVGIADMQAKSGPVTATVLPDTASFGVLGYVCPTGGWTATETPYYMYNTPMNADGSQYINSTDLRYWPRSGGMRFFAYYPYQDQSAADKRITLSLATLTGAPYIDYTAPTGVSKQVDLMGTLSDVKTRMVRVPLTMNHLLTKISFQARMTANNYENTALDINRISLMNVKSTSRYSYAGSPLVGSWGTMTGDADTVQIMNGGAETIGTTLHDVAVGTASAILIPQDLTNILIEVVYTVNTTSFTRQLPLKHTLPWTPGTAINYQIEIPPTDGILRLTIKTTDWIKVNVDIPLG